jgi:hypothetical protein
MWNLTSLSDEDLERLEDALTVELHRRFVIKQVTNILMMPLLLPAICYKVFNTKNNDDSM